LTPLHIVVPMPVSTSNACSRDRNAFERIYSDKMPVGRMSAALVGAVIAGAGLGQACQRGTWRDIVWADFGWPWVVTAVIVGWATARWLRDGHTWRAAAAGAVAGVACLVTATAAYYDFDLTGRYRLFWLAGSVACGAGCGAVGSLVATSSPRWRVWLVAVIAAITLGEAFYRLRHPPPWWDSGSLGVRYRWALLVTIAAAVVAPQAVRGRGVRAALASGMAVVTGFVAMLAVEFVGLPAYRLL
jgi:hypothetical protein